ncbi:hypothetical protein ACWD48_08085 [Streptomyces sp. NPDC002519]
MLPPRWQTAVMFATVTGALLLLPACAATGTEGSRAGGEPRVTATPVMLRTAGASFPLDAYEATPEQHDVLLKAQGVLTRRCMARFGFSYQPPEQPTASTGESNARVFGLTDMAAASRYGYQNPRAANPPVKQGTNSLTKAEELALGGEDNVRPADMPFSQEEAERTGGSKVTFNEKHVPVGGCNRESFLKLYAPKADAVDMLFVFNLRSEADSKAREDSRVRQVDKRWTECMAKAGYTVTDPVNPTRELGITESDLAGPKAITAAKADVGCKQKVNLVGVHYAVANAYQRQLIDKNAQTLALARKQLQARLVLAASLTR